MAHDLKPTTTGAGKDRFRAVGRRLSTRCVQDLGRANSFEPRIARERAELIRCFRLVYDYYSELKFIDPNPSELIYQRTFGLSCSRTILAKDDRNGIVGTLTIVGDNPLGLQIASTYSDEVNKLRDEGRHLAEVTCLAINSTGAGDLRVFYALTRFMFQFAAHQGYSDLLLAIHPRHTRFYERFFGAIQFGPCRPHRLVRGNPAVACRINMRDVVEYAHPSVIEWYVDNKINPLHFQFAGISLNDHQYFCERVGMRVTPSGETRRAA